MNLFIDTTSNYIIFSLFDENVIASKIIETKQNQSEIFIDEFSLFLNENSLKITDIINFFFARGPGSFTGVRVGLTFAKGLKVSGYKNIYTLSSIEILFDQYQNNSATIDARGNKYYYQEIKDGVFLEPKIVENLDITTTRNYSNSLDKIAQNVVNLVNEKRYSKNLDPLYIKEAF